MIRHFLISLIVLCHTTGAAEAKNPVQLPGHVVAKFGMRPSTPEGSLPQKVARALEKVLNIAVNQSGWDPANTDSFDTLSQTKDPRLVWTLVDIQRFTWRREFHEALTRVAEQILGASFDGLRQRSRIIDKMIAWNIPAYPRYVEHKRRIFTNYVPGWEKVLVEGDIAWQLVDWGGVNIDSRPYGTTENVCNCIPAVDNPAVSSATQAKWLDENDIVFGIVVNGEARAYPRRIMEVREMVTDTLGGRDLGIPYCTLCGAAQAYFTDQLPTGVKRPILRTSGLLIRSNKVMYDIETHSLFDTFLGKALTGPLADIELQLEQTTVITARWSAWRAAYPNTTVLVEDLALGRDFNLRETRDAKGPIFPIGDVDPRLPVHEDVVGVLAADGTPVAFPRAAAMAALSAGQTVALEGVNLELFAGGLRATETKSEDLKSHQAFWFAWSQFHPHTLLWGE